MKHLICEICGADILAKSGGIFVCTGCGMQYDRERIMEMAAQYHRGPEQTSQSVSEETPNIIKESLIPRKKVHREKIITIIVVTVIASIALLALMLPLLRKPKTDPLKEKAAISEAEPVFEEVRNPVEEDIQGLWYYDDPEIGWHEEHYFCGGMVASITWLDAAPEKANNSVGEYEVLDSQIRRRSLETDYVLYYDYYYEGDELVLGWYIDSGRGAGSSRIYRKISDSRSPKTFIPENFSAGTTAKTAEKNVTSGMQNALEKAESYLQIMAFSRQGLIDQLEYDGFTYSEAVYAVDYCGADWYQQAVERAQSYLDIMSFSRQGLIEQLEYDGFLYDQAVYGVDKVY